MLPIGVFLVLFIAVGIVDNQMGGMFGDSNAAGRGIFDRIGCGVFCKIPKGEKLSFEQKLNAMARRSG